MNKDETVQQSSTSNWFYSLLILLAALIIMAVLLKMQSLTWAEIVWFLAFSATFIIRLPFTRLVKNNQIVLAKQDPSEKVLLFGMFASSMFLPGVYLITPRLDFANYTVPEQLVVFAALLQIPYLWLFWRSHADLGRNWSPTLELHQQHELVTNGVYARLRHPMYSAIWLFVIGQPFLLQNWIAGFLIVPAFTFLSMVRIPREEAMLCEQFGQSYIDYSSRTGRLLPRLQKK